MFWGSGQLEFPYNQKPFRLTNLSNVEISRQQTPVHICPVPDIWIVIFRSRGLEYFLHESLGVVRLLQEQLDDGRQDL